MHFIKKPIMAFIILDNFLTNIPKKYLFKSKYILTGKCKRCGQCCKKILLSITPKQLNSRLFSTIAIKWIEWIFGFELLYIDREDLYLAFKCNYHNDDGTCGNYFWRANVCRNFPLIGYFKKPVFLPNCGYSAKLRR